MRHTSLALWTHIITQTDTRTQRHPLYSDVSSVHLSVRQWSDGRTYEQTHGRKEACRGKCTRKWAAGLMSWTKKRRPLREWDLIFTPSEEERTRLGWRFSAKTQQISSRQSWPYQCFWWRVQWSCPQNPLPFPYRKTGTGNFITAVHSWSPVREAWSTAAISRWSIQLC